MLSKLRASAFKVLKTALSVFTVGSGGVGCGSAVSPSFDALAFMMPGDEVCANIVFSGSSGIVLFSGSLMEFDLLLIKCESSSFTKIFLSLIIWSRTDFAPVLLRPCLDSASRNIRFMSGFFFLSRMLILMSIELREICIMIHVMSPKSNINFSLVINGNTVILFRSGKCNQVSDLKVLCFKVKSLYCCHTGLASEFNWSKGVEDGEAKIKNKNI